MDSVVLDFCKERMSQAHQEQLWAVAIVSGMLAFIAASSEQLLKAVTYRAVNVCVVAVSLLEGLFVYSRHLIWSHYNEKALEIIEDKNSDLLPSDCERLLAGLSGVLIYALIIAGMTAVALLMLRAKNKEL